MSSVPWMTSVFGSSTGGPGWRDGPIVWLPHLDCQDVIGKRPCWGSAGTTGNLTSSHMAHSIMPYGKEPQVMTSAMRSDSADLIEIRTRLAAGPKAQYFYVALLGLRNYEPLKIYAHVRLGLSFTSFERFQRNTSLSSAELAALIQLPPRTIARRRAAGRARAGRIRPTPAGVACVRACTRVVRGGCRHDARVASEQTAVPGWPGAPGSGHNGCGGARV